MRAFCLTLCLLYALPGCAVLPVSGPESTNYSVVEPERSEMINAFKGMLARQKDCASSLEASVTLTYKSWFTSGAVGGFLQAMSPSYIKFVAVSPLGQPLLLLATDGDQFHFIDVSQAKIYEGPVETETFNRYAPMGFRPEYGYYWLIGRLWPGQIEITSVTRDKDKQGFWFDLASGPSKLRSRVLFDPERFVFTRHELFDGDALTSIRYDNHNVGICPLPGRIFVETSNQNGAFTMVMTWQETDQSYIEEDFEVGLPNGFQRIFVK